MTVRTRIAPERVSIGSTRVTMPETRARSSLRRLAQAGPTLRWSAQPGSTLRWSACSILLASLALTACRGTGHLGEYEYPGRTLAVAWVDAPYPELLTGPYFPELSDGPLRAVLDAGARIAKEVEASKVRARMDSATARVDVVERISDRTLERSARYLRTTPSDDEMSADFVLEIRLREYGIDAKDWNAAAHFFVKAQLILLDGRTGREIWESKVSARDPVAPAIFARGSVVRDVVTAATFSTLSVDEIARALERLADYSADHMTERLRNDLDRARGELPPPIP